MQGEDSQYRIWAGLIIGQVVTVSRNPAIPVVAIKLHKCVSLSHLHLITRDTMHTTGERSLWPAKFRDFAILAR